MWNYADKQLKQFDKNYTKEEQNTLDEFQNIFNSYKDIDGNANKTQLNSFYRRINKYYEYLDDYGKYQANKYLKRRIIRNRDIFWFDLFLIYSYSQYKLLKLELETFKLVALDTYNKEVKELDKYFTKKKVNIDSIVDECLKRPNSKGYIWQDYKDAMTEYNTQELYNQAIQNIRAGKELNINNTEFKKIFLRQKNRLINVKENKTSGALDNEMIYIANTVKIETYLKYGIEKVKFIAIHDKSTTPMCVSLDGQEFYTSDWNKFYRYSAVDNKNVLYTVKGLEVGINLPPIDNHYHACRSTIAFLPRIDKNK